MSSKPVKILLLEDDAGDARLLRLLFQQVSSSTFEITRVERLSEALKQLSQERFDIILSDLDVPDSRDLATLAELQAQAPGVPVVVLTGLDDESKAVKAVQQGAQDYLIKGQANGTMVLRSLRYALERNQHKSALARNGGKRSGKVLSFIGAKGGVGTTTVAINVAAALAGQIRRVVAVELRPTQGSFSLQLGQRPAVSFNTVLEMGIVALNEGGPNRGLPSSALGLQLICGPRSPEDFGEIDPARAGEIIDQLADVAEYTIVDLPCEPSAASQAAIRQSDHVVLVVDREPVAVSCGRVLLEVLSRWGVSGERLGAVVVSRTAVSAPMKLSEIQTRLDCEIVGVIPPAADEFALSQRAGSPLVLSQSHSLAAVALTETAYRLAADQVMAMKFD